MIEINLLPEQLKGKPKGKGLGLKPGYFFYLIPCVVGIMFVLHIYLALWGVVRGFQFRFLSEKWRRLEPERKMLEDFNKKYESESEDTRMIRQLIGSRLNWAQKLNKLSLNLPAGVWLNELAVSKENFILKGSSLSLQKEEVSLINKFMDNLKNDTEYFKDFQELELGPMQRRTLAGYDIVDFVLEGTLKKR